MSDFKPQGHSGQPGHEETEIPFRPIFGFVIGLIMMDVVVWVVLAGFMRVFVSDSKRSQALKLPLFADGRGQFPPPNNQVAPRTELAEHRRREREQLEAYGWVDRKKGIARIPIERALDILAQDGLPKVKNIPPKGAREATKP